MAFSMTVAGVEREVLIEQLNINAVTGQRGSMVGHFVSEDGSLDIALEDELILQRDSTRIFRGTVAKAKVRGFDGPGGDGGDAIVWEVLAYDSSWPLDFHYVTVTIAAGATVKAALQALLEFVPELTLEVGQVDGPSLLQDLVFVRKKAREAFQRVISEAVAADADGWFLRITHDETLEAIAPGGSPAPFDLVEGEGSECGDLEPEDRRDDDYADRVIVDGGVVTQLDRSEPFVGDGSTMRFPLLYTPYQTRGYVQNGVDGDSVPINETLGTSPAEWEIDEETNELVKVNAPAPALGDAVVIRFDGTLRLIGDTGETSPPSRRTILEELDGLTTLAEAQAAASRLLIEYSASQKTAIYPTRRHGLQPGDAQVVTSAKRKIPTPATFYVTEISTTFDGAIDGDGLLYSVSIAASQVVRGGFRETYRLWALAGTAVAGPEPAPAAVIVAGGGVNAAPPSVTAGGAHPEMQYNNGGRFAGTSGLKWDSRKKQLKHVMDQSWPALVLEGFFGSRSSFVEWSPDYSEIFLGAEWDDDEGAYIARGTSAILIARGEAGTHEALFEIYTYTNLTPGDPITTGTPGFDANLTVGTGLVNGSITSAGVVRMRKKPQTGAFPGAIWSIQRNTGGGGAAGCIQLEDKNGNHKYIWVDAAGKVRIHTSAPLENGSVSDTAGTVVGSQS